MVVFGWLTHYGGVFGCHIMVVCSVGCHIMVVCSVGCHITVVCSVGLQYNYLLLNLNSIAGHRKMPSCAELKAAKIPKSTAVPIPKWPYVAWNATRQTKLCQRSPVHGR